MYTKTNVDFTFDKAIIHLTGNTAREQAEALTEIEDMSYLMVKLLRFNIEEYTKKILKDKKDGVLVIFERIYFDQLSNGKIPAMLPMYIVCCSIIIPHLPSSGVHSISFEQGDCLPRKRRIEI